MTTIEDRTAGPAGAESGVPPSGDIAASAVPALAIGALGSLGAGAVHAAAVGVHADVAASSRTFAALALLQIAAGAFALLGRTRPAAAVLAAVNAAAFGGWVLAKTTGISFIEGMGEAEAVQLADGLAAAMAWVAVVVGVVALVSPALLGRLSAVGPGVVGGLAAVALTASMTGMVSASTHSHAGGDHSHGAEAASGHDHATGAEGDHAHAAAVVAPVPYDPTKPIDLGGVEGVTPEQQAAAENLVAITLDRLPQFADPAYAESVGYHSIGDGFTGHEHYIKWELINDDVYLNPDEPESLVYEVGPDGERKLVSAMFMMREGTPLEDVPELGGPLTQWHVHDDLCFSNDPVAPRVVGVTSVGGPCTPPAVKLGTAPMIHVWITPHVCGPFAALEGVAAGQVKPGETHLCDHAHGA